MTFFKVKRVHSPDGWSAEGYKRRRLLEDFARLSLGEGQGSTNPVTQVVGDLPGDRSDEQGILSDVSSDLLLPRAVKRRVAGYRPIGRSSAETVYERILDWIKEDASQVTRWVDWARVVYVLWRRWFLARTGDIDMDTGQVEPGYATSLALDNSPDTDVDMDA